MGPVELSATESGLFWTVLFKVMNYENFFVARDCVVREVLFKMSDVNYVMGREVKK